MSRRIFRLLPSLLLLCAAQAAQGQAAAGPCEKNPSSDPAYYADMKVMPPGLYGFSYAVEKAQHDDASAPVALRSVTAVTSSKERSGKLSCAEVENRSGRVVRAMQLRWTLKARAEDGSILENGEVLAKGLLPLFEVEVAAARRQKVELRGAHFADFMQPLAARGEVKGSVHLTVGVARVEFTDGTALDLP